MDVDGASAPAGAAADVKYSIGTSALAYRKDHMEIEHPMTDGLVENWDLMEKLWDHAFKDRLRVQPELERRCRRLEPRGRPDVREDDRRALGLPPSTRGADEQQEHCQYASNKQDRTQCCRILADLVHVSGKILVAESWYQILVPGSGTKFSMPGFLYQNLGDKILVPRY